MLATQLNNLIHDKQLEQFTLIKVKKHICNSVPGQSKRVVVILELEIVTPGSQIGSKIGTPQTIGADGKAELQRSFFEGFLGGPLDTGSMTTTTATKFTWRGVAS